MMALSCMWSKKTGCGIHCRLAWCVCGSVQGFLQEPLIHSTPDSSCYDSLSLSLFSLGTDHPCRVVGTLEPHPPAMAHPPAAATGAWLPPGTAPLLGVRILAGLPPEGRIPAPQRTPVLRPLRVGRTLPPGGHTPRRPPRGHLAFLPAWTLNSSHGFR